jgi:hypothetical protein
MAWSVTNFLKARIINGTGKCCPLHLVHQGLKPCYHFSMVARSLWVPKSLDILSTTTRRLTDEQQMDGLDHKFRGAVSGAQCSYLGVARNVGCHRRR